VISPAFLSPDQCEPGVRLVSPLERALAGIDPGRVRDRSHLGKLELRGNVSGLEPAPGDRFHRIGPRHGLYIHEGPTGELRGSLAGRGFAVIDQTAAYAAFEVRGEDLLRRLTDLDLEALPASGLVARVRGIVTRADGDAFVVYVAQEHGHYACEAVLDALEGLGR
jgi:hypothetical protein